MDYSDMLDQIQNGRRMKRSGWNGRAQFVFILPSSVIQKEVNAFLNSDLQVVDQIWIKTSSGSLGPYSASNCDQLAKDWSFYQTEEELNAPKPVITKTQKG